MEAAIPVLEHQSLLRLISETCQSPAKRVAHLGTRGCQSRQSASAHQLIYVRSLDGALVAGVPIGALGLWYVDLVDAHVLRRAAGGES